MKDGKSLGLSIVGGCDHSSHPFGVDRPGVFISKIASNSPAARFASNFLSTTVIFAFSF